MFRFIILSLAILTFSHAPARSDDPPTISGRVLLPKAGSDLFRADCEFVYPSTIVVVDNSYGIGPQSAPLYKKCLDCERRGQECWLMQLQRAEPSLGATCIDPGLHLFNIEAKLIDDLCRGNSSIFCIKSPSIEATLERPHRVTKVLACTPNGSKLRPADLKIDYEYCGQTGEQCCKTGIESTRCVSGRIPTSDSDPCKCVVR